LILAATNMPRLTALRMEYYLMARAESASIAVAVEQLSLTRHNRFIIEAILWNH
jgi:hypothetical protein